MASFLNRKILKQEESKNSHLHPKIRLAVNLALYLSIIFLIFISSLIIYFSGERKELPIPVISLLETAIDNTETNSRILIGEGSIEFLSLSEGFDVSLRKTYFQLSQNIIVSIPEINLKLKLYDLLLFNIILRELEVVKPNFIITQNSGSEEAEDNNKSTFLSFYQNVIYNLFKIIDKDENRIPIEKIDFSDAKFNFNLGNKSKIFTIDNASMRFFKLQDSTYLRTEVKSLNNDLNLSADARLVDEEKVIMDVDISNFPASFLKLFSPDLEFLSKIQTSLSGSANFIMNRNNPDASFKFQTSFLFNSKKLKKTKIDFEGLFELVKANNGDIIPVFKGNIGIKNFPMNSLSEIWPEEYAKEIRNDVLKRYSEGKYNKVNLLFELALDSHDMTNVLSEKYKITGNVTKADVIFNPRYPKVEKLDGNFEYNGNDLTVKIKTANIGKANFTETLLELKGLNDEVSMMELSGKINGNLVELRPLLKAILKGRDRDFFYNTREISAPAKTSFYYKDNINDAFIENVAKLNLTSNITNLEVKDVIKNISFSAKSALMKVDESGMSLTSEGLIEESPANVEVFVGFVKENDVKISVNTEALTSDLAKIIPSFEDYSKGIVELKMEYTSLGEINYFLGNANAYDAEIKMPFFSWNKKLSEFGTLSFYGTVGKYDTFIVKNIQAITKDSVSVGKAIIPTGDEFTQEIYFKRLLTGENDNEFYYSSSPVKSRNGKVKYHRNTLKVFGKSFDASSIITSPTFNNFSGASTMNIEIDVNNLYLNSGVSISNAKVKGFCDIEVCLNLNANGNFDSGGNLEIYLRPEDLDEPYEEREFYLSTNNFGRMLSGLGLPGNIEGGIATIKANTGSSKRRLTEGSFQAKKFKIVKAPILTKIFSLASFSGIREILTGSGIKMDEANGEFKIEDGLIQFEDFLATGDSLGITMEGDADLERGFISVGGAVSPSYSFNSFLGRVPVLGYLFRGDVGEGLIATRYSVKGKIGSPEVSVNPLSALTPGVLRGLWGESESSRHMGER